MELNKTPDCILQVTLKQGCTIHCNSDITKYCYTCDKNHCEMCLIIHKNHRSDTVQTIKEKLLKYLAIFKPHSGDIPQQLVQKISDLTQHRKLLHKQYQEVYALTEQTYNQKIRSLCQKNR